MVWYPREELIVYIHDEQITKYGGRMGFHRDPLHLTKIISGTRRCEGDIYRKAAYLLRNIVTTHVFKDGHHRTAFVVAYLFLKENGGRIHCNSYGQARTFFKGHSRP